MSEARNQKELETVAPYNISYEDQRFDLTKFYRSQQKQRSSKYKISFKQEGYSDAFQKRNFLTENLKV